MTKKEIDQFIHGFNNTRYTWKKIPYGIDTDHDRIAGKLSQMALLYDNRPVLILLDHEMPESDPKSFRCGTYLEKIYPGERKLFDKYKNLQRLLARENVPFISGRIGYQKNEDSNVYYALHVGIFTRNGIDTRIAPGFSGRLELTGEYSPVDLSSS